MSKIKPYKPKTTRGAKSPWRNWQPGYLTGAISDDQRAAAAKTGQDAGRPKEKHD